MGLILFNVVDRINCALVALVAIPLWAAPRRTGRGSTATAAACAMVGVALAAAPDLLTVPPSRTALFRLVCYVLVGGRPLQLAPAWSVAGLGALP